MREIKFRAWDKELKRMFDVAELDFSEWWVRCTKPEKDPKGNGGNYYGERNSFKNEETDRHILMQYTGIKDKIGIEIYEGDLLSIEQSTSKPTLARVKYLGSSFGLVRPKAHNNVIAEVIHYAQFNTTVIGNIFDNPELLEVQ